MAKPTIRSAQLINPFGVGSLCEIDGQSLFVRGTGSWDSGNNLEKISVSALSKYLRPRELKAPRNSVAITRFPRWHFCPDCRQMAYWSHERDKQGKNDDGSLAKPTCGNSNCKRTKLVPMRFVAVCDNGHLDDIYWYGWAHRQYQQAEQGACDPRTAQLTFEVSGKSGGDFSSMRVRCGCGSSGSLEGIADGPLPQKCGGRQPGEKPVSCVAGDSSGPAKMYMEPRGSSALHYASLISALDIAGDADKEAWTRFREDETYKSLLQTAEKLLSMMEIAQIKLVVSNQVQTVAEGYGLSGEDSWSCFMDDLAGDNDTVMENNPDFTQETILDKEFPALADPVGQNTKWLITRPEKPSPRLHLDELFERVVRVERLREVRAFRGFQRRNVTDAQAMISPSLGRNRPDWLPATQVMGEGIFIEFSIDAIKAWLSENAEEIVQYTKSHLASAERLGLPSRLGFNPTPAFIMVHTFSHLLINQLSFDCGYSSTSLRERVYCGPNSKPFAGVLIYTADSDAEGSMGGLSEMGSAKRIEDVVYRAVARSQWCSSDPVCRELETQGIDGLNRAACHACSLVAETSCTFSNVLLDRVLVAGDGRINGRGVKEPIGFFNRIAEI